MMNVNILIATALAAWGLIASSECSKSEEMSCWLSVKIGAVHCMDFAVRFNTDEVRACEKVCLHGYDDCIHNPEYLRRYHPEYWVELGMPTECNPNECYYDDEDK